MIELAIAEIGFLVSWASGVTRLQDAGLETGNEQPIREQDARHPLSNSHYLTPRCKMQKGFIASIIAMSLVAILVLLWIQLQVAALEFESTITSSQPIIYPRYYFDNVFNDVRSIAGPSTLSLVETNTSFSIVIGEKLPKANFTGQLDTYKNFLEATFSATAHANFSANFSNLTDGTYELSIGNLQFSLNYTNQSANSLSFGPANSSGINITRYDINVTVSKYRASRTQFVDNPAGDLNITLIYSDLNGTVAETKLLNSNAVSSSRVTYTDGSFVDINIGSPAKKALFYVADNAASPAFVFVATLSLNESVDLRPGYLALLNYTQSSVSRIALVQR